MEQKVYAATTQPLDKRRRGYYNRQDKSDLGADFIAPDGGWAWLVCVAAGLSNLSLYPCLQQFGFMFRQRLITLGLSSSHVTTIINTNPAVSACTGLLNGPMFRRFTFRQVAMVGALLCFSGILLTAFCETFAGYMFAYALLYGFGMGISVSASSLAINTYFQQKRRRAAGFSWTITGLGPIFLPYLVTFLLEIYDVKGTVMLFAAISLHAFVSALIYQPVRYHTSLPAAAEQQLQSEAAADALLCSHCTLQRKREPSGIFSSQYLCQDDDVQLPGYEIIEPGTPMLSRANDGWYGSKLSLASGAAGRGMRFRTVSSSKDLEMAQRLQHAPITEVSSNATVGLEEEASFLRPNNFRREREETQQESKLCCTCAEQRAHYVRSKSELEQQNNNNKDDDDEEGEDDDDDSEAAARRELSFLQKVITFFDLDLLRDITFVNLVAGLTVINFGELNFSILTPFILTDFGLDTSQITVAMSLMASMDITMRFLVPFLTEKIPWDNRVFFLIGVVGIAIGRSIVASTRSYAVILGCFVWIGLCKGVRTIFWPLIIPGYVPLNRLPGASGLQLLISGLFTLLGGPFVGLVRDRYDYSVALHCLDAMSFLAAGLWTLEALLRRRHSSKLRS